MNGHAATGEEGVDAMSAVPAHFRAFRIHEENRKIVARFEQLRLDDLAAGDVVVRVSHSSINYKDALAATGAGRILRRYPLVGGVDLAGEVVSSADPQFKPGDKVLVTGCGLSETQDGGYAEFARLKAECVIPIPPGLDAFRVMVLGTAGFTAALAIHRMEHNGQTPAKGPIVVTGATGGVGSIAIDMLAARGYEVVAVSGKPQADDYLRMLGASQILRRQELDLGSKPLEAARWGGAIDNVGGEVLTWLTRTVDLWGNIASIGLAGSADLKTTVMPFILRGVTLIGINSSATPRATRLEVWKRIAGDLKPRHLDRIATQTISFDELPGAFDRYLQGGVTGRTVVLIR
jgi:acrylyl-CoA reductase (NADPH)